MNAKEFYELNKGKYFTYNGEKVRVVGYDYGSVIISTKKKMDGNLKVDTMLTDYYCMMVKKVYM